MDVNIEFNAYSKGTLTQNLINKMKKIIVLFCTVCLISVQFIAQHKTAAQFQLNMNRRYSDETESPLTETDRKKFKGLPFFTIDTQYTVVAKLKRIEDSKPFEMKTTTARRLEYVVYAIVTFKIRDKEHQLNLYKSYGSSMPDYEDYLFLPFTDETSGDRSYGGGRFIDLRIPDGEEIIIDFNQAYNPYCAYNHKYSCPIPPKENHVATRIEAGVKYESKE